MRQVVIVIVKVKGKLHNLHAGKVQCIPQFFNFRCNDTEVFGNEGEVTQFRLQPVEKIYPRPLDPGAVYGSLFIGRY